MSRKRSDVFSEIVVGLFMLAVLSLLVYFTIVISGVDVLQGREKVAVNIAFDGVGGLKSHDSVMYRGTKVGAVEDVVVTDTNLIVRIEIDRKVVLRDSYRIAVCNLSMLGGNYLLLEEGEGEVVDIASTLLNGETPTDWMRDVARIARNLNELTSRMEWKSIVTNLDAVGASARTIATRLEQGEGTLGKLLSADDTVYNDLKATAENASAFSAKLNDEAIFADLKEGIAAFKKACESFEFGDMKGDVAAITDGAKKLLENLNSVAEKLKNGDSTLGALATDREMYNEVQGLIKDCRQVLDNYRDTTPIATFGSLVTGAL